MISISLTGTQEGQVQPLGQEALRPDPGHLTGHYGTCPSLANAWLFGKAPIGGLH